MANKILFTVFLWFCCFCTIKAQVWPKYHGQQNRREYAVDIIETYDKGYLICGYYNSPDYTQRWGWLIKTNINGDILWEKIIENTGKIFLPYAIEQAHDGGILICGISGHGNKYVPIVIKINACGEKEWCKVFLGSPNTQSPALDIKETKYGDIVVLVSQYGIIGLENIYLFKLNSVGEVLWQKPFASTYNNPASGPNFPRGLSVTNDGNYMISAKGFWEHPWNPGGGYYARPLIIKVDSLGNELWVTPFGLNDTIVGWAWHTLEFIDNSYVSVGVNTPSSTVYYGLIMSIDKDGNELCYTNLSFENVNPNANGGTIRYISEIDSMFILGAVYGDYFSPAPWPPGEILLEDINFDSLNILGSKYYTSNLLPYAVTTLSSGKYLSSSTFPHSSTNYDIFLAKLNLNLEYDTAYTGNFTYDSLCIPGPPQSGFIYLNDCAIDMDLPGDSNCDAAVNVNDVVSSVARILGGNPQPFCFQNADVNGDGVLNVADVVGTVSIIISRRGRH